MLKNKRALTVVVAMIAAFSTIAVVGEVVAQGGLAIGGQRSNFGSHTLRGGFMPDPYTTAITSGGSLDSSTMSLAPGCTGFVTRQPDFIVRYNSPASFLRFYFTANDGGDTTLVINDANGRWHCNDDSHGGLNPTVDIAGPPGGQYDIWVGSYRAGQNIRGTLHVTELRSRHPGNP